MTMADSHEERELEDRIAEFSGRIERLRRDGVSSYPPLGARTPWPEAADIRKLEEIVWESMTIWLRAEGTIPSDGSLRMIAVPGIKTLEVIEREVDYAGLPAVQRELLLNLRDSVDAGQLGEHPSAHKDLAGMALARIIGVGHFDQMLRVAKECDDKPWDQLPEAGKVSLLVDLAQEAGPPGGYTLWVVEREVDYEKLPAWRRQALEQLSERFGAGELDGENPNPSYMGDRAEYALRLAEFEARVEDYKHFGIADDRGIERRWQNLSEGEKFDRIMGEMRELHLESEPAAYRAIDREIDIRFAPEERRQNFGGDLQESWLSPAAAPHGNEHHRLNDDSAKQSLPSPSEIAGRRGSHPPEPASHEQNGKLNQSDRDQGR
jgi:hypothetical protein